MKINSNTKISVIIAHNKAAIEAIASVNPHFNKLRNPILRKILAPRVSIADAARIGKCNPEILLQKLQNIGFEIDMPENSIVSEKKIQDLQPELIRQALSKNNVISFDVRPLLEGGTDPFLAIKNKLKETPEGYALEVINSFEPTPLISILKKKGYLAWVKIESDKISTYFMKEKNTDEAEETLISDHSVTFETFKQMHNSFLEKQNEIDVRDLEMPLPMLTILGELETLPEGFALYVRHKKVPQYLIPELEQRNFKYAWFKDGEYDVKLLIFR